MKKIINSMLSFAMLVSLVGCGTSSANDPYTFTIAKENDVISMNSMYATDGMSIEVINAIQDGLMESDADNNLIYAVANSHEVSEDGLTYTFTLRDDVIWSNGVAVTAHDFVYAWKTAATSPDSEYSYLFTKDGAAIQGADEVVYEGADISTFGVAALDDFTFQVELSQPTPYFLSLMTFPVFFPLNEEFVSSLGDDYALIPENLLSNGPFVLDVWQKGTKLELSKNESYYDKDAVSIEKLVFNITPEISSSVTAFEAGSVDFTRISSDLIDKYKDSDSYVSVLEGYLWYFQFNLSNEFLQNDNLRLAFAYAMNREDLVENILKDGSVAAQGFVPNALATGPDGIDFRESAGDYFEYDVELAQMYFARALAQLDVESITLSLLYENADPAKSAAEYLQSQLQSALPGLTIEMDMQIKANRIEMAKAGDFEIQLTRWGPDYADPTTYLNLLLSYNAYNYGGYANEDFDALIAAAGTESDETARWELLKQAELVIMQDLPVLGVFQVGGASLINSAVDGVETHAVSVPYVYKNVTKTVE